MRQLLELDSSEMLELLETCPHKCSAVYHMANSEVGAGSYSPLLGPHGEVGD